MAPAADAAKKTVLSIIKYNTEEKEHAFHKIHLGNARIRDV